MQKFLDHNYSQPLHISTTQTTLKHSRYEIFCKSEYNFIYFSEKNTCPMTFFPNFFYN